VNVSGNTQTLVTALKTSVNGVLEHELSVGDVVYVKNANKMVVPFNPGDQYGLCLANEATVLHAKLLVVARLGLLAYWGDILTSTDVDESVSAKQLADAYAITQQNAQYSLNPRQDGKSGNVQVMPNKTITVQAADWDIDWDALMGTEYVIGVSYRTIFLHMKDVGMLVAANLVRTGHHYQKTANGSFKAMERKRWGKDAFDDESRGILYHEAMHPFTHIVKARIYTEWLAQYKANNMTGTNALLDAVVTKRLPVVPAGAAWLSAGLTVMAELRAIPAIGSKVPKEYDTLINEGIAALQQVKTEGKVKLDDITKFEAVAAFAYGVLSVVAPTHSAVGAPSLKKKADEHLGASAAGTDLARTAMRA
jgi:hypothetical protein